MTVTIAAACLSPDGYADRRSDRAARRALYQKLRIVDSNAVRAARSGSEAIQLEPREEPSGADALTPTTNALAADTLFPESAQRGQAWHLEIYKRLRVANPEGVVVAERPALASALSSPVAPSAPADYVVQGPEQAHVQVTEPFDIQTAVGAGASASVSVRERLDLVAPSQEAASATAEPPKVTFTPPPSAAVGHSATTIEVGDAGRAGAAAASFGLVRPDHPGPFHLSPPADPADGEQGAARPLSLASRSTATIGEREDISLAAPARPSEYAAAGSKAVVLHADLSTNAGRRSAVIELGDAATTDQMTGLTGMRLAALVTEPKPVEARGTPSQPFSFAGSWPETLVGERDDISLNAPPPQAGNAAERRPTIGVQARASAKTLRHAKEIALTETAAAPEGGTARGRVKLETEIDTDRSGSRSAQSIDLAGIQSEALPSDRGQVRLDVPRQAAPPANQLPAIELQTQPPASPGRIAPDLNLNDGRVAVGAASTAAVGRSSVRGVELTTASDPGQARGASAQPVDLAAMRPAPTEHAGDIVLASPSQSVDLPRAGGLDLAADFRPEQIQPESSHPLSLMPTMAPTLRGRPRIELTSEPGPANEPAGVSPNLTLRSQPLAGPERSALRLKPGVDTHAVSATDLTVAHKPADETLRLRGRGAVAVRGPGELPVTSQSGGPLSLAVAAEPSQQDQFRDREVQFTKEPTGVENGRRDVALVYQPGDVVRPQAMAALERNVDGRTLDAALSKTASLELGSAPETSPGKTESLELAYRNADGRSRRTPARIDVAAARLPQANRSDANVQFSGERMSMPETDRLAIGYLAVPDSDLMSRIDRSLEDSVFALAEQPGEAGNLELRQQLARLVKADPLSKRADRAFRAMVKNTPGETALDKAIELVGWASSAERGRHAMEIGFHGASYLYREGLYEETLVFLERSAEPGPAYGDRLMILEALCHLRRSDHEKALPLLRKLEKDYPESAVVPRARFLRAWAHMYDQRNSDAQSLLTSLIQDFPGTKYAAKAEQLLHGLTATE